MPFLKMKSNSITGCLREKSCLCVCSKSATITKNTCSRVKILRESDIDLCVQSSNVTVCNNIIAPRIGDDKDFNHHPLDDDDDVQSAKRLLPLTDPLTLRTESTENTNASTLFSPALSSNETRTEADLSEDAGVQSDGNLIYDNITDMNCLPDFKCDESGTLFDVAGEDMILPFLEDTYEATCDQDVQTLDNTTNISSDDSSLYFAIHQLRYCDQDLEANNTYAEQDQSECFDPHMFISYQPDFLDGCANSQLAISQKEMRKMKSVTLVLDLDETLVHSTLECCDDANFSFPVFFNMKENMVYVRQRPYLQMFLERVVEMFDVVVFTASQSIYAEQLLDKLDPDGKIISRRAYRESCTCLDGNYIKDLAIFGVDLAKIAIIDNSPQVFQLQVNNGIPIKSWFDDPSDHALISLLPFLETLADADDVRPLIAKRFGNKE